jgi:hypothetical protein
MRIVRSWAIQKCRQCTFDMVVVVVVMDTGWMNGDVVGVFGVEASDEITGAW